MDYSDSQKKLHAPETCDTLTKLRAFLTRRKNKPSQRTICRCDGGPYAGQFITLATDGTLPIRTTYHYGRYTRLETDLQNKRIYGAFLSNSGYRGNTPVQYFAKWIPYQPRT
jgi:hypothetical protein